MSQSEWKIVAEPDEMTGGLFGQVVMWIFEILPYLHKKAIYPNWDIKSKLYGTEPDFTVIPGIFDLAYIPNQNRSERINLQELRNSKSCILGNDWHYLHELWHSYFKVPDRIIVESKQIDIESNALGIHYRGTDKNYSSWDTNPVSQEDFLMLIQDFLRNHQDIKSVFIATDEFSFVEKVRQQLPSLKIINLGEVLFHLGSENTAHKGDRALLDCVLLSRCKYLLKCSSALSGFAKVLNPDIESYRVSASKLFCDYPYFLAAYVPKLNSANPECIKILEKQLANDWSESAYAKWRFGKYFKTKPRYFYLVKIINSIQFKPLVKFKRWVKRSISQD